MMRRALCLLACLSLWAVPAHATIATCGSSSNPADNSANNVEPLAVTPPASMQAGDLAVVIVTHRGGNLTLSNTTTGGQTWTDRGDGSFNTQTTAVFTATFDGTWDEDPAFGSDGASQPFTLVMHCFRPTGATYTWSEDVALTCSGYSGVTEITITGATLSAASAVALAIWNSQGANAATWGSLSGTGWTTTGGDQYRNTSGSDMSSTYAHFIGTGATGDVTKTQSFTFGGGRCLIAFAETAPASTGGTRRSLTGVGR